jgi:transposase
MTPRKAKKFRMPPQPAEPAEPLRVQHPHAAGIDVHAAIHWVAVPVGAAVPSTKHPANLPPHVRSFGACTADLETLADWLRECGITTIAMESTGVYWVPLFELLESRGFQVFLVDPRQTRQVAGRPKTDILDCQWIQRLHAYGLLAPSFRPEEQVVVLRGYLRQRQMLIRYAGQHIQHLQKALEQMNVKLAEVVSDITGVTGMAIIKAILRGERDPLKLAMYRHEKCQRSEAEIARALYGTWRAEHLFSLQQALELYEYYLAKRLECDEQIERHLATFADQRDGRRLNAQTRKRGRKPNQPTFDVRSALHRFSGVDLTVIEGIDQTTALVILSEIGRDMSKWPTVKHFVSWLGLCPQHQASAGRIKRRRVRGGTNPAAKAMRLAAQGCWHAKSALGAFYRRIQARCGGPKAVVATARKIAERVYRLLKYGAEYVQQAMAAYEEKYRQRLLKGLSKRASELGYQLVPTPEVAAPTP